MPCEADSGARPKTACWRSKSYMRFVRSRPCAVTGFEGEEVVAHHVRCLGFGGIGLKPPDWMCVPLLSREHTKLHDMGEKSYWAMHGMDPAQVVLGTMLLGLAQVGGEAMLGMVKALGPVIEAEL